MSMEHLLWFFKIVSIPTLKITHNLPQKVTQDDILICERLIKAYQKATADERMANSSKSELWLSIIKDNYGKLLNAIESNDPEKVATIFSSFFKEKFSMGLTSGDLYEHAKNPVGAKIWSLKYHDNIVALAEYLGVVRNDSPEQGKIAYELKDGVDTIVKKTEEALGVTIGFPDVGAPYGVKINGSLITMEHPENIFVALRVQEAIKTHLPHRAGKNLNFLEIVGGLGETAFFILKQRKVSVENYISIDLPVINIFQGYFLSKVFGASKVRLFGENKTEDTVFSVFPPQAIGSLKDIDFDVLINQNSLPEIPEDSILEYLNFARKHLSGIFVSYNHEAYAPVGGVPQNLPPEIISRAGGFKRLSRTKSWLRSAYVEEIYKVVG